MGQEKMRWSKSELKELTETIVSELKEGPFDISDWDVSSVTSMRSMFYSWSYDLPFSYNLSGWNVSNVSNCLDFVNQSVSRTSFTIPSFTNCSLTN